MSISKTDVPLFYGIFWEGKSVPRNSSTDLSCKSEKDDCFEWVNKYLKMSWIQNDHVDSKAKQSKSFDA